MEQLSVKLPLSSFELNVPGEQPHRVASCRPGRRAVLRALQDCGDGFRRPLAYEFVLE